ncbi:hypothetical protein B0J12DRAFT_700739 [Macrophomina phaseolina]|uniref:Uncharacterized protein n=1 Tax=Macrophomina phaseolina TaxID=35725 RepID=A0ABQ8G6N6_9PEZI|nr:hypothetical protein B0J12DRAFT_700739 [Macrophomina phaseolina]
MFFKCHKAIAVALLALPYVSAAHATIIINCKDPVLAVVLDVAVDEAVTMAQDAANKLALENRMEATNKAAWQPLFSQSALPRVIGQSSPVEDQNTGTNLIISRYLSEDCKPENESGD